jgi:hypothetical protein
MKIMKIIIILNILKTNFKIQKNIILILAILMTSSCATYVTYEEVELAAGYPPSNQQAINFVKRTIAKKLTMGEKMESFKLQEAAPGMVNIGFFGERKKGWVICYSFTTRTKMPSVSVNEGYIGVINEEVVDENHLAANRDYCKNSKWIDPSQNGGIFDLNRNIWGQ